MDAKKTAKLKLLNRMMKSGVTQNELLDLLAENLVLVDNLVEIRDEQNRLLVECSNVFKEMYEMENKDNELAKRRSREIKAEMVSAIKEAHKKGIKFQGKHQARINGLAGAKQRHAKMEQVKAWTIDKYRSGRWSSANSAAHALKGQVLEYSRTKGAQLTETNAQRTIAEWIRKSRLSV